MGFEDLRHTCLVLGLGLPSSPPTYSTGEDKSRNPAAAAPGRGSINLDRSCNISDQPTLTLSLAGDTTFDDDDNKLHGHDSGGAASSFSNGSVKREREIEEDDENNNGSVNGIRKKLRLTKAQSALLEESFLLHSTLNPKQKHELAQDLKLRPRQVEVWFQNRRARTKLKQTEVDCEFLKKCCETLTDENRRLQKELHELKSLKSPPPPLYMQFPAATLTVCPSCEKIGGGGVSDKTANKNIVPFAVATKPHFYNPSAAC
ncbi:hypothetical protein ABFS82_12G023300 [Erythranthe guttata]|uniref:Homeobox domain-containing protein n=1 Tax=Erythranthe guttata TaxID=4155 RepID=A0A022RN11_ERYGU|nr:PREDICTED: homeobox-leucine zipper protein HAT22-like [Erythranthe guttata]EYU41361.1 hypothetical protein MIMGU_mgv1a012166mg [Erythranthe guttata]|eukprot:XP_012832563.1 PREDICTED: homeobox-leucine zipper protein HAT22-like [Erythranthe guttata]